jgi:hypothetical protein
MEVSGQLHAPATLPPGKEPWYPLDRRLEHRAVLDVVVKRKIPSPRRESNRRTAIVQPAAQRCTNYSSKQKSFIYVDLCEMSTCAYMYEYSCVDGDRLCDRTVWCSGKARQVVGASLGYVTDCYDRSFVPKASFVKTRCVA